MSNPFIVFRTNWKKVTFLTVGGLYAIHRIHKYCLDREMMRYYCFKAQEIGDQKLEFNGRTRHVTVILNPLAGKRKAKKNYTKFVEPLLHLAGIKVSLIETENPGQAAELMKIMSNCDSVAIVGGDGTVNEVLNGLLSRPDADSALKTFPIAIIPAGTKNTIAEHIHRYLLQRNYKEFLASSTMSLVYGNSHKFDVMNIKDIANVDRPAHFALKGLKYGIYQDVSTQISPLLPGSLYFKEMWYKLVRILRSEKYPHPNIERIEVTEPCIGCSRCHASHHLVSSKSDEDNKSPTKRWWTSLVPIIRKPTQTEEEKEELLLAKRENTSCNIWRTIETNNVSNIEAITTGDKTIRLSIHKDDDYLPSEVIQVKDVRLHVRDKDILEKPVEVQGVGLTGTDDEKLKENEDMKQDADEKSPKFNIDGEPTLCRPVELSALKRIVTVFTGPLQN